MIKIGISVALSPPDPHRLYFKTKTLLYVEESLSHWINSQGALAFPVPTLNPNQGLHFRDLVRELDGLILQGGADVSPKSYGEIPLKPEWSGDYTRDCYEISLLLEFLAVRKPVLGICRGAQILNVAMGGTLYQDIETQIPGSLRHRNAEVYDQNFHRVNFADESWLQKIYPGASTEIQVNSIHHQSIRKTGNKVNIAATCPADGVIEAIRLDSETFAAAVQWHPEFMNSSDPSLLDSTPLLENFLDHVRKRKEEF
jgi:putative glutamine amidotransferase